MATIEGPEGGATVHAPSANAGSRASPKNLLVFVMFIQSSRTAFPCHNVDEDVITGSPRRQGADAGFTIRIERKSVRKIRQKRVLFVNKKNQKTLLDGVRCGFQT